MDEEQDDPGIIDSLFGPAEAEAGVVPAKAVPKGTLAWVLRSFPRFFRDALTSKKTPTYTITPDPWLGSPGSGVTRHDYSKGILSPKERDMGRFLGVPSEGGAVRYNADTNPIDLFRLLKHELTHVLQGMGVGPLATEGSLKELARTRPRSNFSFLEHSSYEPARRRTPESILPVEIPAYASEHATRSVVPSEYLRTDPRTGQEFIEQLRQAAKQFQKMRKGGQTSGSPE